MTGVHLKNVIELSALTTEIQEKYVNGKIVEELTGAYTEIFKQFQDIMGFTYSTEYPPDRTWGGLDSNGEWTG